MGEPVVRLCPLFSFDVRVVYPWFRVLRRQHLHIAVLLSGSALCIFRHSNSNSIFATTKAYLFTKTLFADVRARGKIYCNSIFPNWEVGITLFSDCVQFGPMIYDRAVVRDYLS